MQVSSIHQAKTHLSELIKKVESGEEVVICKAGRPAAVLIKYTPLNLPRKPGALKGKIKIADDFDDLPDEFMNYFR